MTHLIYLATVRYPTEKAYGVTIGNTVSALNGLNLKTSILVWGKSEKDLFKNPIESVSSKNASYGYNSKIKIVAKIAFIIQVIRRGFEFLFSEHANTEGAILWTREPLVLLPHAFLSRNRHYLFELHHSLSLFNRTAIKLIAKKHQVKILALTESAKKNYSAALKNMEIYEVPMGVSQKFFEVKRTRDPRKFVLGYLGKGISSGNDNRIDSIIEAAVYLKTIKEIQYQFVGLEQSYENQLQYLIERLDLNPKKFIFINQVVHSDVPKILSNFSIGVIPYPQSKYNDERFPLKALEYAASGLPIIATDTPVHRKLLSNLFTNFFDQNSPKDLSKAVLKLYESSKEYEIKASCARTYAEKYTYELRAKKIIDLIQSFK